MVVATLEHLLHGDERQRLKQSWLVHDLKPEEPWIMDGSGGQKHEIPIFDGDEITNKT